MARQSWDALPIIETMIAQVNALGYRKPNYIYFLDRKKSPIGDLDIKGVDAGETKSPHIDPAELDTDLDHILAGVETLPELVERQDIPTIEQ